MNGWLLIDKPQGWTSFDVVNKVRGIIARDLDEKPRRVKVGHTGTLDPQATGLLILGIGKATKQIQQRLKADKSYHASVTLGSNSTTGDSEGELTKISEAIPSQKEVDDALSKFVGDIEQLPPQFSALKVDGVPAYKRARRGEKVELKPRPVTIYEITEVKYYYPTLEFACRVSSGTYIRTLAEDTGKELNTGAYLSALRRTSIGQNSINEAIVMDDIDIDKIKNALIGLD